VPTRQLVQAVTPADEAVPAAQLTQGDVGPGEYEPEAQTLQLVAPESASYWPSAHLEQLDAPDAAWYMPLAHMAQALAPEEACCCPAPQLRQLVERFEL